MVTRRTILRAAVLPLVPALTFGLPGCGGGEETNPDGSVKLAPGTTDPEAEGTQGLVETGGRRRRGDY